LAGKVNTKKFSFRYLLTTDSAAETWEDLELEDPFSDVFVVLDRRRHGGEGPQVRLLPP